jgi:hypothetical protein
MPCKPTRIDLTGAQKGHSNRPVWAAFPVELDVPMMS